MSLPRWLLFSLFCLSNSAYALPLGIDNRYQEIIEDYQHYYAKEHQTDKYILLGTGALFANTGLDRSLRNRYQKDIRSHRTNRLSQWFEKVGGTSQLNTMLPLYIGTQLLAAKYPQSPLAPLGHWGNTALRTTLLMAPQQALLTNIGAHRPTGGSSHWGASTRRAVSGHAAYGAVPLLSIASLSHRTRWEYFWVAVSTLPALSRINDDKHYFSQALLGWGVSYFSWRTVSRHSASRPFRAALSRNGVPVLLFRYDF